ncbi:MAG: ATP-binding protein [Acidobacteriota bacterium]
MNATGTPPHDSATVRRVADAVRPFKDTGFLLRSLLALGALLTLLYYLVQRGGDLPAALVANRVLLFILWYINVILIVTVLFILARSLIWLLLERRSGVLGASFKMKLVASAVGLSLLPVLILFPFATRLVVDSIESWFQLPIVDVVAEAASTAEALSRQIEVSNLRSAGRVLDSLRTIDLDDLDQRPLLQTALQDQRTEQGVDYLAVYDGTDFLHAVADPQMITAHPTFRRRFTRFLDEAIRRGRAIHVGDYLDVEGRLILAARALPREVDAADAAVADGADVADDADADDAAVGPSRPPTTVVVAGTVLPPDLAQKSENLLAAYQTYQQLSVQKDELRASYLLLLFMVTMLVVLAFTSISLRLARRVTHPIQALVEGTRRVRTGNLEQRVEVEAVDAELGVLVDGFNRMISELQRSRDELVNVNRRVTAERLQLAAVLQNVAAGVLAIDAAGRIATCNDTAQAILAQRAEDLIGHTLRAAWADEERAKLAAAVLAAEPPAERLTETRVSALATGEMPAIRAALGQTNRAEVRLTVRGVWKTLDVKVSVLPPEAAIPGGRVVVLEDLTDLIHAQKMATWNEVARRIAHEIKNPLTPIKLTAERLLHRYRQQDPRLGNLLESGVETIVREVGTMKSMVDEFSRFARMPQPQPRAVDLIGLIEETVGLYRGLKAGVTVAAQIDPDAAQAWFDPDQLKSVLINLLDNALNAVESPGAITVSTRLATGADGDPAVLLSVADTGHGISPETRDKLFLPYFSTKGRGTGLGLAIVQRIVSDHGASIWVDDNQPRGAVFSIRLPRS